MATATKKTTSIPANVKKPQDHAPAKEDVIGPKDVTVEWNGHEYLISGEALDDAELLEYFTDENFIGALRSMLGVEQWKAYKENERNDAGRVTASGAAEFLGHALEAVKRGN
jgi:hypothetical protein